MLFLFSPVGRISRRGFWFGFIFLFLALGVGAFFLDEHLTRDGPIQFAPLFEGYAWAIEMVGGPAQTALLLLSPFSVFAVTLKRLHDTGRGIFMLIWKGAATGMLAWFMGESHALAASRGAPEWVGPALEYAAGGAMALLWLRVLFLVSVKAGDVGENRFGPDPLR